MDPWYHGYMGVYTRPVYNFCQDDVDGQLQSPRTPDPGTGVGTDP